MKLNLIPHTWMSRLLAGVTGSLWLAQTAGLEAKEEWLPLLPEKTIAVLSIKSTPELVADWDTSSIGRFLEDPAVVKWMAPLYKDGQAPWDKMTGESGGGTLREELSIYPGASMAAFMLPDAEAGSMEPIYLAFSEMGDKKAELMASMEKQAAKKLEGDAGLKAGEDEVEGVTVRYVASGDGEEAAWVSAWAEVGEVLVEGNDRATMAAAITGLQKGAVEVQDDLRENFKRFQEIAEGPGDVVVYVDAGVLLGKLNEVMAGEGGGQPGNPFSPDLILGALSLNEIRGFGLSMDLQEGSSKVDTALLHRPKPQGLIVKMMHGVDTKVELPAFVPAGVAGASVTRWSLLGLYDNVMATLNQFGPMVGGMVQMQMGQMEQQLGVKLRDDLFATTDDELIQVSDVSEASGVAGQVMGIKLKDAQRFGAALEVLKKLAGNGFGVFEETEFAGFKVWKMKATLPGVEAAGEENEMAYALTKDYFLLSTGSPGTLQKVLARMADPTGKSLWDEASVKEALGALPANATGLGVSNGSTMVKTMLTAMMTAQETLAAKAPKGKPGKGQGKKGGGAEESAAGTKWFDLEAMPSDEVFARYFGMMSTGSYSLEDAAHYRVLAQPVEAQ